MTLFDRLALTTTDFAPLGRIPDRICADGGNQAPSFTVDGVPDGTVELAFVCHDPDAPLPRGFTHWTRYGIPADAAVIGADVGRTGPNTLGEFAWTGPQPPAGHGEHHYYFWVYALGRRVGAEPTRERFLDEYGDAILEQARLVGTFSTP